jgi:hypothetical protein
VRKFLEVESQAIEDGLPQWRAETGLKKQGEAEGGSEGGSEGED